MAYIVDLLKGAVQQRSDRIGLERYLLEDSYITKYLSRVVKDKALIVYLVLFKLSYFETGKGQIIVPWAEVGSYIRSEQGNIIENAHTVKRRLVDLLQNKCITVERQRGGANEISVHLPSEIPACRVLIEAAQEIAPPEQNLDAIDYYTAPERRLEILARDKSRCMYCLIELSEDSFVLDHVIPVSKGGTNYRFNLVSSCESCNQRKLDQDPIEFLVSNYRGQLLKQKEFLEQKAYVEKLLTNAK